LGVFFSSERQHFLHPPTERSPSPPVSVRKRAIYGDHHGDLPQIARYSRMPAKLTVTLVISVKVETLISFWIFRALTRCLPDTQPSRAMPVF